MVVSSVRALCCQILTLVISTIIVNSGRALCCQILTLVISTMVVSSVRGTVLSDIDISNINYGCK